MSQVYPPADGKRGTARPNKTEIEEDSRIRHGVRSFRLENGIPLACSCFECYRK